MKYFTKEELSQIISLMKEGKSLNYISKKTGRYKSTLYYHYKKLLGKKFVDIQIDKKDIDFLGELMGLFAGDGCCFYEKSRYKYTISFFFNLSEIKYVEGIVDLFNKHLNKKPSVYKANHVLILRYYSKYLFNFIQDYVGWYDSRDKNGHIKKSRTVFLKDRIYSSEFKKGFLRGFIDSDGYISDKKILFSSTSTAIMKQTEKFLLRLGFKYYKLSFYEDERLYNKGMWHLYIHKSEREKFFSLIKPRNLTKVKDTKN